MEIIKKQEDLISNLQDAVNHYLSEGEIEAAQTYSNLLKTACESYKLLTAKGEIKEERNLFKFKGHHSTPEVSDELSKELGKQFEDYSQQRQMNYQKDMELKYQQEVKPVFSSYTYGDGADNPKIRASDGEGNWKYEQPNQIIVPPQQLIPNKYSNRTVQQVYQDVWQDEENEENDLSFQDYRRNV